MGDKDEQYATVLQLYYDYFDRAGELHNLGIWFNRSPTLEEVRTKLGRTSTNNLSNKEIDEMIQHPYRVNSFLVEKDLGHKAFLTIVRINEGDDSVAMLND